MLALKALRLNGPLILKERQFLQFIIVYRWLALLLTPTIALMMANPQDRNMAWVLYALAWANNLWQTAVYLRQRSASDASPEPARRNYMVAWIGAEVVLCVLLNGLAGAWTSPYYLYSLAPIFQAAMFYGLSGAVLSAVTLSLCYLATLSLNVYLTGFGGHNWFLPVSYLTCFFLSAAFFGYLTVITNRLRHYARTIEQNQLELSRQHEAIQKSNQRLEHLAAFSQLLQSGNSPARIESLALEYLNHLARPSDPTEDSLPVFISRKSEADGEQLATGKSLEESIGEIRLDHRPHLAAPLVYQRERFGTLMVDQTRGEQLNQRLLLALLADQLARALGHLKQSQALAVEAERGRMAKDMHDVIAQALFGIGFNLDACLRLIDKQPEVARRLLEDLRHLAFDTLTNVRAIIYDLWNEETNERNFVDLISGYIDKIKRLYPIEIGLETENLDLAACAKLPPEIQKGLYRVVQEALANCAKHSGASKVLVRLDCRDSHLHISVSDNGVGFGQPETAGTVPASNNSGGGMGLVAMRKRLEQLGGTLKIESSAGQGTQLEVSVSLNY